MKNIVQFTKTTRVQHSEVSFGKGVKIILESTSVKMVKILIQLYQKDSSLLEGDIHGLIEIYKVIVFRESIQNLLLKYKKKEKLNFKHFCTQTARK